ncbi:DNA repair protein RecO [Jannaschia aquimarina]|uniref:DNA repair protein RecO n=1 Tax=Jannaschia aquimarina TaxID=935700 RepID=A0A0D1EHZ7_9RHOB|nr:DNA repair protein RecO [Jannaschia aquimarina]KIT16516.1 DNA repair protein RecO [Jannaschia aquimarina]SNT06688.1 DNA replication and repair protein RecO [Jannaschia aquimarina]
MEWRDEGIVLAVRRHGETSAIVELLTDAHGRHLGVVHGGTSRRMRPVLQPGNRVQAVWRARLESHLGSYSVEALRTRAGDVLADPLRLAGLASLCALSGWALPEREAVAEFAARTEALAEAVADGAGWLRDYVFWEMALLEIAGFRLDLSACAAGGGANDLAYVSPRTGRAVSRSGAGQWADRLLPLPEMLIGGTATLDGVRAALDLTGFFLRERVAPALERPLPAARDRLIMALAREG